MDLPYAMQKHPHPEIVVPAPNALVSGQPFELPDGRAAVYQGLQPVESGADVAGITHGVFEVVAPSAATASADATIYWHKVDLEAKTVADAGNTFVIGSAQRAKVSGETRIQVALNE